MNKEVGGWGGEGRGSGANRRVTRGGRGNCKVGRGKEVGGSGAGGRLWLLLITPTRGESGVVSLRVGQGRRWG